MVVQAAVVGRGGLRVRLAREEVAVACAERGWSVRRLATEAGISRPTAAAAIGGGALTPVTAARVLSTLKLGRYGPA
jgi:predicted transcriptional regulator